MKMNKMIAAAIISTMILSTTACGSGGNASTKTTAAETTTTASSEVETAAETQNEEDAVNAGIEAAIAEYQYACQTSDVDAVLNCLDPGFSQALKSGRLLLNWMSTKKNTDEAVMNTLVIAIMNIADISVDLSTMDIQVKDITTAGSLATAEAEMKLACSTGEYKDKIKIRLTKDGDKWYITGIES